MMLGDRMYQAATQVNVLSPEILHIVEVDALHYDRKQYCCDDKARKQQLYRGLRQWHDTRWKTCELGRSIELFRKKYIETSRKGQGSMDGSMEVGLIGSTRSGKAVTESRSHIGGSDQRLCNSLVQNRRNTQRLRNAYE